MGKVAMRREFELLPHIRDCTMIHGDVPANRDIRRRCEANNRPFRSGILSTENSCNEIKAACGASDSGSAIAPALMTLPPRSLRGCP